MLTIDVLLGSQGVLKELRAQGHAGFSIVGKDILCSSATVLLRTFCRTFERSELVQVSGEAKQEGDLYFYVENVHPEGMGWAKGVSESLLVGISDLAREFPNHFKVMIR